MKKLNKILVTCLSALFALSLGVESNNVHASINVNNYGVDIFPSKKTHNRFAYQLRKHGHHSRIHFASVNSKLGKALFHKGSMPNIDYANYMDRHEHKLYKSINKKLVSQTVGRHAKSYRHQNKKARKGQRAKLKNERINKRTRNKRHIKRYNRKVRTTRHGLKHRARKQHVYKAHFKRSNNKRALTRSGFYNAYPDGGHFIFNKYAPSSRRAVVSKKANTSEWFQGTFGENGKYISVYDYNAPQHGWILVHKAQPLPGNAK